MERQIIYGFWRSISGGDSYGPFVNRNHFAGWMLMTLPGHAWPHLRACKGAT